MPRTRDSLSLRHYGPSAGSHAHDHFQVLLGVEGVLELEVQGKGRRLAPGGGCVIGPGERHDFEAQSGARCLVLDTTHPAWATCPEHPTQFASRCRVETGMSAMQWLRDLRMARARALRAQGLGTALVAQRCGYRSASALVAAMRLHGRPH